MDDFEFSNIIGDDDLYLPDSQETYMLLNIEPPPVLPAAAPRRSLATGELPSKEDFPGELDFQMTVGQPDIRRQTWQYSASLRKAFIKVGCNLPIQFKISQSQAIPQGLNVRAVAVFSEPADAATLPVLRCPGHRHSLTDPVNRGYEHLDHVVRCNHSTAVYEVDPISNRHSVCVNLRGPQPGADGETFMFAMMCRSSCNGFNRRPLVLIFTLEKDCDVVGRQVLPVRVCAAPKRDCTSEETKMSANNSAELEETQQEDEGEIVQPDGLYQVPIFHTDDHRALAQYAKELAERDYADTPDKQHILASYEAIISDCGGQR